MITKNIYINRINQLTGLYEPWELERMGVEALADLHKYLFKLHYRLTIKNKRFI